MKEKKKHRVLVCPLGWGLGHASRNIPIIDYLLKSGHTVIVAGDELQISYLTTYFPGIKTIKFPSLKVNLSKGSNQLLPILGIAFRLPYLVINEHFAVKKIVNDNQISVIISDNRYGLWHRGTKSVLITHQLRVPFPKPFRFLEPIGELFVRLISQKFTYCWIPDSSGEKKLAGKLSHPSKIPSNARYIGLLSRFKKGLSKKDDSIWDLVGIASGPSPQREIFIDSISKLGRRNNLRTLIIKGVPSEGTKAIENGGIFYAGHLGDIDFQKAIQSSKYLITRAGYSTIMDLTTIGVRGLIVPTPGQTEQEYLTNYLSIKGIFKSCKQIELENLDISMALLDQVDLDFGPEQFEKALNELINSV